MRGDEGNSSECLAVTARRATKPLELLYGDLSRAMLASTGGSVYRFLIVDCYSNLGWPIFLKDKSADTVIHAFRAFLAAIKPLREKHGEPGALRTDNGTEFVNEPFANLLVQYGIRREFTSVDGPKRNGRVERRIALVKEGARAAWLEFPRLFPDVQFPSRAMHYSAVWPEAWTWMSENINITSRVDSPDKRCPEEKLYGKRLRKQLLPFLIPGHRTRGSGPKWVGKANPCFYLNGGNDHASDCDKVMLESGIVSYTTNATYAYSRAPFVGQQVTFGNGVIRAPSPPPAATSMGGSGSGGLAGQSEKSDAVTAPSPPPAASPAGRGDVGVLRGHPGRRGGIGGAPPFLHCRGSHRQRKETPAVYEVNRRSGVNRTAQTYQRNRTTLARSHGVTPSPRPSPDRRRERSWAWAISQGRLRFYPRRRASVRQLPPWPRPIPTALSFLHARPAIWRRLPRTRRRTRDLIARFGGRRRTRSSAVCARLAHSRSWGAHSNEGST